MNRGKILDTVVFAHLGIALLGMIVFGLLGASEAKQTYIIIFHIWLGVLWLDVRFSRRNT